jgi:outer membrane protein insertion porin family/translocation and assembly module TamA
VKLRPEARFYAPIGRRFVLAGRLGTALLLAASYGGVLDAPISIASIAADGGDPEALRRVNREVQLLEIRGLFSGGPGSNRGYGFNQIAPHRVLDESGLLLSDADAIGGRTSWEASLELRALIVGELGGAVFVDASDVTAGVAEYRLSHPHVSTGFGLRYGTPVGPLRVDLGFRIPGLQVLGQDELVTCIRRDEPCTTYVIEDGDPTEVLGLPLAVAIAIGNAV